MNQIPSISELARRVGRSKSSVHAWTRRVDWPFGNAPWPATFLSDLADWMEATLQDDRAEHRRPDPIIAASEAARTIEPRHLSDPTTPFYLLPRIGQTLYSELTMADVDHLAACLNFAMWSIIGERFGLEPKAPRSHYEGQLNRLWTEAGSDAAAALSNVLLGWLGDRFIGRKWWAELPDPMPALTAKQLAACEPLPHRASCNGCKIERTVTRNGKGRRSAGKK